MKWLNRLCDWWRYCDRDDIDNAFAVGLSALASEMPDYEIRWAIAHASYRCNMTHLRVYATGERSHVGRTYYFSPFINGKQLLDEVERIRGLMRVVIDHDRKQATHPEWSAC